MKIIKTVNGKYAIRKLSIFGYLYLDRVKAYWWSKRYAARWATFLTREAAEERLANYTMKEAQ